MELFPTVMVHAARGDPDSANRVLERVSEIEKSEEVQARTDVAFFTALTRRAEGRLQDALALALTAAETGRDRSMFGSGTVKYAIAEAVDAYLELGNVAGAGEALGWLEELPPGQVTPFLQGTLPRLRARVAAAQGVHDQVEEWLRTAVRAFREAGMPFFLAVTLLDQAEWLIGQGRITRRKRCARCAPYWNRPHRVRHPVPLPAPPGDRPRA